MFKGKIVSMCSHDGDLFVATTEAVYALDGSGTWRVIPEIAAPDSPKENVLVSPGFCRASIAEVE